MCVFVQESMRLSETFMSRHILSQGGEVLKLDFTFAEGKHVRVEASKVVGGVLTIQNEYVQVCAHTVLCAVVFDFVFFYVLDFFSETEFSEFSRSRCANGVVSARAWRTTRRA